MFYFATVFCTSKGPGLVSRNASAKVLIRLTTSLFYKDSFHSRNYTQTKGLRMIVSIIVTHYTKKHNKEKGIISLSHRNSGWRWLRAERSDEKCETIYWSNCNQWKLWRALEWRKKEDNKYNKEAGWNT